MDELYDYNELPLSLNDNMRVAQQKLLKGEILSIKESLYFRGDKAYTNIDEYETLSNWAYRAIDSSRLEKYLETGFILSDEFANESSVNRGIDWYLGGFCVRYGEIIVCCPAYKEYFKLTTDNGNGMCGNNPNIKHIKSSGIDNPIPIELCKWFKITKTKDGYSIDGEIMDMQRQHIRK